MHDRTIEPSQSDPELRLSEERFRTAFAYAAVGMALIDIQGRFLHVNPAYCAITGYGEQDLHFLDHTSITYAEDRVRSLDHTDRMLAGITPGFVIEQRYVRKDGTLIWVQNSVSVIQDKAGLPCNILVLAEDITARKQAQAALAISEARARRIFDANVVGVIYWNLDTCIITNANDLFLDMVGYTRDDLIQGKLNWQEMTPPDWRERNDLGIAEIRSRRRGSPYEKEYFRKDGSRAPIIIGGALFDDSNREGFSLVLDISEQKRVENALRVSEERYRSLTVATTQVIWTTDAQGAMIHRLDSWSEYTGQKQEEYRGFGYLEAIHPEDRAHVHEVWGRCLETREVYECEYRLRDRMGSYRNTIARAVPMREESGRVREWIGTNTDITERVQHLRQIEELNARLTRSIQETHHRVKNNLQIISALVDVQVDEAHDHVPVAAMARIGQHTRSLAAIHDLLTQQAKSDAHTNSLSSRVVLDRLLPLLESTVGGRRIRYEADEVLLPIGVGTSLTLLVSELVSNAIKHGRTDIEVTLKTEGETICLEVCDDGPGFPPDFDWRTAANTGMGLIDSSARHDLRGSVSYENRREGGGRVIVRFPNTTLPLDQTLSDEGN
ncbi:MAG: multi-sensor hybrid histidine kinase [Chthonomonadaceae bacterium]|nr:multi-sensor hybrid histidine kinase [Chthonomonadaceae bacterium]